MSRPFDPASFAAARRKGFVPNAELRVSDAERHEIAEVLSRHFADGRLDDAEFNDRVSTAMAAKTRGDLAGLLADLPPLEGEGHPAVTEVARHRPHPLRLVALVLGALFLIGFAQGPFFFHVWHPHVGLVVFVIVMLAVWSRRRRGGVAHREHPVSL